MAQLRAELVVLDGEVGEVEGQGVDWVEARAVKHLDSASLSGVVQLLGFAAAGAAAAARATGEGCRRGLAALPMMQAIAGMAEVKLREVVLKAGQKGQVDGGAAGERAVEEATVEGVAGEAEAETVGRRAEVEDAKEDVDRHKL